MGNKLTPERVEGLRRAISENEESGRSLAWHEVEDILSIFSDFAKRMTVAPPTSPGLLSAEDATVLAELEIWSVKSPYIRRKLDYLRARLSEHPAAPVKCPKCNGMGKLPRINDLSRDGGVCPLCQGKGEVNPVPAAPQAEVTEERKAMLERVRDWREELEGIEIPKGFPIWDTAMPPMKHSDIKVLKNLEALILATDPGSTAGKPAPVRVSRATLMEKMKWWSTSPDSSLLKNIVELLRELGMVVEPDKEDKMTYQKIGERKTDDINECSNGAGETKSCGLCEEKCAAWDAQHGNGIEVEPGQ